MNLADQSLLLKIIEIGLPAVVAAIVGGLSVWLGNKQLHRTAQLTERQMTLSAKLAADQFGATLAAANMSYRAQVLSGNRQEWINTLRDLSSAICADISIVAIELHKHNKVPLDPEMITRIQKLRLMLNPTEEKSIAIYEIIDQLGEEYEKGSLLDEDQIVKLRSLFMNYIQRILKEEWERVKKGI